MRWTIVRASIDVEGSELEEDALECLEEVRKGLESGKLDAAKASNKLRSVLSVSVDIPVKFEDGVEFDEASEWLDENNGRFAPCISPFCFADDQECTIEVVEESSAS